MLIIKGTPKKGEYIIDYQRTPEGKNMVMLYSIREPNYMYIGSNVSEGYIVDSDVYAEHIDWLNSYVDEFESDAYKY